MGASVRVLALLLAGAMLFILTAPAQAGDVYTWRTEDGGTAFTDDPKSIPARYRSQIETRQVAALDGYERFSGQDSAAADRYEARLAERLERLRALNRSRAGAFRNGNPHGVAEESLTLRNGYREGSEVDLSLAVGESVSGEPIVVETVKMRLRGSSVVQAAEVVRRGDEILAVRKPQPRQWNLSDPVSEADVLRRLRTE